MQLTRQDPESSTAKDTDEHIPRPVILAAPQNGVTFKMKTLPELNYLSLPFSDHNVLFGAFKPKSFSQYRYMCKMYSCCIFAQLVRSVFQASL